MQTVLIVIHLMVVLALVGVVLLQRSEGGGLGIGGGSGFMTARGAANALTRATGILAVAFFATSLGLSLLARYGERRSTSSTACPARRATRMAAASRRRRRSRPARRQRCRDASGHRLGHDAARHGARAEPAQPAVPNGQ